MVSLDKVKQAFTKMNETLHNFNAGFVNQIARAVSTNVHRAQGSPDIVAESVKIE